ncbi:hypothetical protein C8Q80DRAFT_1270695 [Daedaleopsis nitida]|nr:hypothetical protein C8Q80DRAFT_1270695 [Daedaleopsis nitida]
MDPSAQSAQAAAEYWVSSVRFNNYLTLVAFAVLFYDYALTFGSEIEFFWKSANPSLVSVLFVIVRYYGLLGSLPLIVEYFVDLQEQSIFRPSLTLSPLEMPSASDIPPGLRSVKSGGCSKGIHLAAAWGAMLWFDTTIFVLTLVKALQMRHTFPGGLLEIMFRDGTIYYGIMVASNVSNIITFMITQSNSPLKGMDTTLTNVFVRTSLGSMVTPYL